MRYLDDSISPRVESVGKKQIRDKSNYRRDDLILFKSIYAWRSKSFATHNGIEYGRPALSLIQNSKSIEEYDPLRIYSEHYGDTSKTAFVRADMFTQCQGCDAVRRRDGSVSK